MIPRIIGVVRYKRLMEKPNSRSSHQSETPSLGGIAFFGSIMISMFFIRVYDDSGVSFNIMAALTIIFMMGMKDDLVVLSAKAKVILQSVAIGLMVSHPDMVLTGFHGFLGIPDIPYWLGLINSYIVMLYIINAFNLIDGIDGLAGLLGMFMSFIFSAMFLIAGYNYYFLLSLILFAFLIPFLKYNFSKKEKIFMGDTGSMIIGFLIAVLTLRFLNLDTNSILRLNIQPENLILVAVSIIFFPVIDVIRVILIRLINKRGPFTPDRCHLHHVLIDKGLSHRKASITLTFSSVFAFLMIYGINSFVNDIVLLLVFILLTIFTFYVLLLLDQDPTARKHRKKIKSYIPESIYLQEFRVRKRIITILKSIFYKDLL